MRYSSACNVRIGPTTAAVRAGLGHWTGSRRRLVARLRIDFHPLGSRWVSVASLCAVMICADMAPSKDTPARANVANAPRVLLIRERHGVGDRTVLPPCLHRSRRFREPFGTGPSSWSLFRRVSTPGGSRCDEHSLHGTAISPGVNSSSKGCIRFALIGWSTFRSPGIRTGTRPGSSLPSPSIHCRSLAATAVTGRLG
jgi:hypothetical protein